jgi:hypothetical protein
MRRRMNARRVAVLAAGLAMATSVGLAGAGAASAASPAALNINKTHSVWTVEVHKPGERGCELVQFLFPGHTFWSPQQNDAGTWSGGNSTLAMTWTSGADAGETFSGHFVSSPEAYKGNMGGTAIGLKGKLTPQDSC